MRTLERAGYLLVMAVFAAFILAFNVKVEDLVTADKVALVPFARPLVAEGPTRVVRLLAHDLDAVRVGQPLFEVVVGDDGVRRYAAWDAARSLPGETALAARYPRPPTTVLSAPASGTFRLDAKEGATLDDKAPLGRVVDYGDLRVEASLSGDTVAQARPDGAARIVNVAVEPLAGTLFRGGGGVSGQFLGEGVKAALERGLVGREVALRDDVPLRVTEVKEVQVDADVAAGTGGATAPAAPLDPPADLAVAAQVVEGTPSATVQIADLPPDVGASARRAAVEAVRGRAVRAADGSIRVLGEPRGVRMVVKLKAGPTEEGVKEAHPLPGTMLSRSYDVKLKLVAPPSSLIQAVRDADALGKAVTCRVELRTGERPIALRLLKKS